MTNSAEKCSRCSKVLPKKEYLKCAACKAAFDLECISMSAQRFGSFYALDKKRRDNWKCPECLCKTPKVSERPAISTPLNNGQENVTLRKHNSKNEVSDETCRDASVISLESTSDVQLFVCEIRAFRTEMTMFREALTDLTFTIKNQNKRIDVLEERIIALETRPSMTDTSPIKKLEDTIMQLKLDNEEREQDLLANDIEVANFPEVGSENGTHVILAVAKKLGVKLEERDVVSAQRVGAPRQTQGAAGAGDGGAPRPRPLAVRLARRDQRDELLKAARVRRHTTTEDLGLGLQVPARPFYVNERLTRNNRQLFQQTRGAASRLGWKYVWTRDGKIFARQDNGKARHRVRSDMDLIKVFGADVVGHDSKTNSG